LGTALFADRTRLTVFPSDVAAGTEFRENGGSARTIGTMWIDRRGTKTTSTSTMHWLILEYRVARLLHKRRW